MASGETPTNQDAADAVQVRWLDLAEVAEPHERRWLECLDPTERARAARFYHARDRRAYIAAHALTRAMLSRALGGPPEIWRFVDQPNGKPSLDPAMGRRALEFNLSHTDGAVACAVTSGRPVGVDIEGTHRDIDLLALARSYFAGAEVALLESLAEERRAAAFFQLWTLKEAYVKARGDGLSLAFDRFAFSLDPIRIDLPDAAPAEPSLWRFSSILVARGHRLSVAARSARSVQFDIRRASSTDIDETADLGPHPNRGSTKASE
ncbi:4'-phosphopantetheinyl transferase superfamily protein [Methylosinus sp. Sm6]|uniref:4'-phosphopantetheinyl transferase family protein n=1 Tax=Methylosinus sp. Sm6 TaxID=2866948 RepID=UPI001C99864D|nr:4'-phosphopantetheinyl transferase superfamily protein [Methylosinus sp. Sm6]MBY6240519.1 4'-phosphopantetheinyl transferase superfamily protein [Methylosinus sp. Sm6]